MNEPVTALLQKEMSRKEFLLTLAMGLASVMGLSTLIHLLTGRPLNQQLVTRTSESGYGNASYGGGKD